MHQESASEAGKSMASRLIDLVKLFSSIKGDLANITAPPFFLAPSSVVENPCCWAERPSVFTAPAKEEEAEKRSLLVLRMFLVGLRNQMYVGGGPNVSVKKPLNAFLGELFLASWTDADRKSSTKLVAEQVSHHPPITAVHLSSPEDGIRADGYARVEMTFSGTVNIRQFGHTILHIEKFDEDYLLPFPEVQVHGFLSACLYPEILGTYKIISSSGYISEINFLGKGFFRGKKKNYFEARVYHPSQAKNSCLYEVSGVWSESWEVKDGRTGEVIEKYTVDAPENRPSVMDINAVEKQDPWESRHAWNDVVSALNGGDLWAASAAKHKVEEAQRKMRLHDKKVGKAWEPLFFESIPGNEHEAFHRLAEGTGNKLSDLETKGVWRFKDEDAEKIQRPFRGDLTPLG
ncbi:oxysterol-binding protein [Dactylonectria estremocensis]|uniref:Oxysterol-binding protein n=1 Tax=Dactylonectria estremocensis TaxID=1079267 RepID=A0A9P9IIV9_9HYPO|nr:oxysterol-binding protein [Dactylonectria estremocensis]